MWKAVPDYYVPGFIMTLKISSAGLLTALILGVIFGTFSTMKFKPAKILSRICVEFIQNTRLASLQVLFYYSVLPLLFSNSGFRIPKFVLGVIGVGVYHGAYISEVIRTGISHSQGAVRSGCLPRASLIWKPCVLYHTPPDDRIIMPLANQALNLVKNTSILAMAAGMDLMYFTDSWGSERNFFAQAYFTSALLYFIICFPLARLARYLEIRSMRMPAPKKILFEEEGTC